MPTAKKEIQEILSDPAFQPRVQPKGLIEELYRYFVEWIAPLWKALQDKLGKSLKDSGVSASLPEWLLDGIATFSEWAFFLLKAGILTTCLWLAIRELRKFINGQKKSDVPFISKVRLLEKEEPLEPYLQRGEFREYLVRFRRKLRREILEKLKRSPSTPDRSLVKSLDSIEWEHFKKTAACYERVVLAGQPLDPQEILQLHRARSPL